MILIDLAALWRVNDDVLVDLGKECHTSLDNSFVKRKEQMFHLTILCFVVLCSAIFLIQ